MKKIIIKLKYKTDRQTDKSDLRSKTISSHGCLKYSRIEIGGLRVSYSVWRFMHRYRESAYLRNVSKQKIKIVDAEVE